MMIFLIQNEAGEYFQGTSFSLEPVWTKVRSRARTFDARVDAKDSIEVFALENCFTMGEWE